MAKKAKAKKTSRLKPRPKSIAPLKEKMKRLNSDVTAIIAAGQDTTGTLTSNQLKRARQAKKALDKAEDALKRYCVQGHAPY